MAKYDPNTPKTVGQVRAELNKISDVLEDQLSKVDTGGNQMETTLDMNNNDIINIGGLELNGDLDMKGNRIVNLAPAIDGTDATNLDQVRDEIGNYIPDLDGIAKEPILSENQLADGVSTVFDCGGSVVYPKSFYEVHVQGVEQNSLKWDIIGPNQLQFVDAPPVGTIVDVRLWAPITIVGSGGGKNFESVALMAASGQLSLGERVTTTSYIEGTGYGGGEYIVTNDVSYREFIDIPLGGGLVAILQVDGTILLEQCGIVEGGTATDELQVAADSGATKVTSNLSEIYALKIMVINNDNMTIDLIRTRIRYIGDYNVYEQFPDYTGTFGNRTVGLITARGTKGTNEQTASNSIIDGVNFVTIPDVTSYQVGDYVSLGITYPRRFAEHLARIIKIDGNTLTLNYTFAWTIDSVTVTDMTRVVKNVDVSLNWYDDVDSITSLNRVSGIGLQYVTGGTCSWHVENNYQPSYISNICQDIHQDGGTTLNPKNVGPGQGYNCQLNNTNLFSTKNLRSERCRHVWDGTHAGNGSVADCYAISNEDENTWQYTTHGAYEHDIIMTNINHTKGQNAVAIAQSGFEFGEQSRRIQLKGGNMNGVVRFRNAKQSTIKDLTFFGAQTVDHEFGAYGDLYLENIRFQEVQTVRFYKPTNDDGDIDIKGINPTAFCTNVDFGSNRVRHTDYFGSLNFDKCNFRGIFDESPTNVLSPTNITFRDSKLFIDSNWRLSCYGSLKMTDCETYLISSVAPIANADTVLTGGTLKGGASFVSNSRIKFDSKAVTVNGVAIENSMGIWGVGQCTTFNLTGVVCSQPDGSHTSQQFSMEDTSNCTMVMSGCHVPYTGSGISVDFGGTGGTNTVGILGSSHVQGAINIASSVTTFEHAGNYTPDTVLP